jgi:hypothetical protein
LLFESKAGRIIGLLFLWLAEKQSRIHHRAIQRHTKVQMRASDATCCSNQANHFTALYLLTDLYIDSAQVAVHGGETRAVVDEHGVAIEKELAHFGDDAISR